jgi:CHAD domain-containing protein
MVRRTVGTKSSRVPESAEDVLRQLLAKQFAVVVKSEPQAVKGSVKALHDIRVALRRMRSLAVTFAKLDKGFLDQLDQRTSKVCDRMGDARDLDVWIELFRSMLKEGGLDAFSLRDRRAALGMLRRERTRLAADALSCGMFRRVKKMLREYLRTRRPARRKEVPPPEAFVARRMLAVRGLIEDRHRRVGHFSKGPAHDLRRAGRRMRYLAEFFAPRLGPACIRAGKWITKAQAALGKVHDCDSALELSKDLPSGSARAAVRKELGKRRAAQLRKFKTAWRHYADRRLQKAWRARLEAAAAG